MSVPSRFQEIFQLNNEGIELLQRDAVEPNSIEEGRLRLVQALRVLCSISNHDEAYISYDVLDFTDDDEELPVELMTPTTIYRSRAFLLQGQFSVERAGATIVYNLGLIAQMNGHMEIALRFYRQSQAIVESHTDRDLMVLREALYVNIFQVRRANDGQHDDEFMQQYCRLLGLLDSDEDSAPAA